ncbi:EamA family transporter [Halobacillus sp. Marseille-Q1614]|uniref:EamA family transporter n=1 Tax=Halobacillus sp. Marseille-Q1614 TaxID=2709134 RepID=UPI0020C4F103|nr:EamA family transporter [Halobacillus sp. Marseille-Q1614]
MDKKKLKLSKDEETGFIYNEFKFFFFEVILMEKKLAPFFVLLAAILWGTAGTAQALAPDTANPVAIGVTRLALGGIPLFIVVLLLGRLNFRSLPIKETLLASFCMACYQPFFFSAVTLKKDRG